MNPTTCNLTASRVVRQLTVPSWAVNSSNVVGMLIDIVCISHSTCSARSARAAHCQSGAGVKLADLGTMTSRYRSADVARLKKLCRQACVRYSLGRRAGELLSASELGTDSAAMALRLSLTKLPTSSGDRVRLPPALPSLLISATAQPWPLCQLWPVPAYGCNPCMINQRARLACRWPRRLMTKAAAATTAPVAATSLWPALVQAWNSNPAAVMLATGACILGVALSIFLVAAVPAMLVRTRG
jgi:hypothetical protein